MEGNSETYEKEKQNLKICKESEDDDCGSFQQESVAAKIKEVTYLESSMANFSTNLYILIDNVRGVRMKACYLYVCGIQEVDGGELGVTGVRLDNLGKSIFVLVVNDQFEISYIQLKVIIYDLII
ncbi:hypothetical protein AVEN_186411-1 [Araneus ventricosus]|uniref:Uncharacterized protein n=1 Tax=Araneus ventricosus TaxID=182803 RepID=A0A4Y2D0S5_ARAVE|nr:hypothetical protein AVEN_186411-1 [Araneus ventricosus]